ncbi:MAG: carbohydrate-binding module family 20 domain-containing protein [Bacteroidota bacterium]
MRTLTGLALFLAVSYCFAQPQHVGDGIRFVYSDAEARSVSLVGDFNGWSKDELPMAKEGADLWTVVKKLTPGVYQYKFVVDGERYENDPGNSALIENYNKSGKNSIFVLSEDGRVLLTDKPEAPRSNPSDSYPVVAGTKPVYLNIIWHQHQPLYVNPETDQLQGPWVRTHATKDYYDMAAMLKNYPDVHCNINLTSSLLHQLREYYVNRMKPFVNVKKNRVDAKGLMKKWGGKTDPWIDLTLKHTKDFDEKDKAHLYKNIWNAFGISEVMIERFPQYAALKRKLEAGKESTGDIFTEQEMREIKFWFYLAQFDPDFFRGPVTLADGTVCDLSDYLELRSDNTFFLRKTISEDDCNRIVAEAYKVMANVILIHKQLLYSPEKQRGQVEVITTPYYHPILPLIYDSDLAKICQPRDALPSRYSYPQDAEAQVARAVKMYKEVFGVAPTGMWPGEGSVAQPVLNILRRNGILWTASDVKVLTRSEPKNQHNTTAYRFPAGTDRGGSDVSMALVFRDTELSDRIGFKYQNFKGEDAAEDFIRTILSFAPKSDQEDVLITVILDGENAWEWYRQDIDGKEFLNAFYRKLSNLYSTRQIITTTTTEYLNGNPNRDIQPHPINQLPGMTSLWPGSWINGNYDTWIGEQEENKAWEYLLRARQDLEKSGLKQPDPNANPPKQGTKAWNTYMTWEAMYAAEGSDWFWWYGNDQSAPAGDEPFDVAFRIHLENMYKFARLAGASITSPGFEPILMKGSKVEAGQGTMARSKEEMQPVRFVCDASRENVPVAVYIVGSLPQLGQWTPNLVRMYDDGTNGDEKTGDGFWTLQTEIPVGVEALYKYSNSGTSGQWIPGEEFAGRNRSFTPLKKSDSIITITDIFGQ